MKNLFSHQNHSWKPLEQEVLFLGTDRKTLEVHMRIQGLVAPLQHLTPFLTSEEVA